MSQDFVSPQVSPQTDHPPPKTRWWLVILGALVFVVLLPVVLNLRKAQKKIDLIQKPIPVNQDDPYYQRYLALQEERLPIADNEKRFEKLSKSAREACKNVVAAVETTEKLRCQNDPHLAAAIDDPYGTSFVGPNPVLKAKKRDEAKKIAELLIADYRKNSHDESELQNQLVGPMTTAIINGLADDLQSGLDEMQSFQGQSNDPLYYYCLGRVENDTQRYNKAIEDGSKALENRPTDSILQLLLSVNRLYYTEVVAGEIRADELMLAIRRIVAAVEQYADDKEMLRFVYFRIDGLLDHLTTWGKIEVLDQLSQLKKPECPEWIFQGVCSKIAESFASHYRGADYISMVADDDLEKFGQYSEIQALHLQKAWTLEPDEIAFYPDLIWLQTRSGSTQRSSDIWYRHSLATELSFDDSFEVFSTDCQPRWGGSCEKLLWLAEKSADAFAVDSELGFSSWYPIYTYINEKGFTGKLDDPAALKVALQYVHYLQGYSQQEVHARVFGNRGTAIARILWESNQLNELRWLLKKYDSVIADSSMTIYRMNKQFVIDVCNAAEGEGADCWQTIQAELLTNSTELDNAKLARIKLAIDEAGALDVDGKYVRALEHTRQLFEWATQFHAGESVAMSFKNNGAGWLMHPTFSISESSAMEMRCKNNEKLPFAMAMIQFPMPYSFEASVQFDTTTADPYGLALQCGIVLAPRAEQNGVEVRYCPGVGNSPGVGNAHMDVTPENQIFRPTENFVYIDSIKSPHVLRIDMRPTKATGFVDAEPIGSVRDYFSNEGNVGFARYNMLNFSEHPEDLVYRIDSVKIKRLDDLETDESESGAADLMFDSNEL